MNSRSLQTSHKRSSIIVTIGLLLLNATFLSHSAQALDEDRFAFMLNTLNSLQSDNLLERRKAAEDSSFAFRPLGDVDQSTPPSDAERVLFLLRNAVRFPKDEWSQFRVLENLLQTDSTLLSPLYLEALKSSSANARWQAIRWFSEHQYPDASEFLESAWRHEARPWVRIDLIHALTRNRSSVHWSDLLKLAAKRDPELAVAALKAFTESRLPEAVPVVAELVDSESPWVWRTAIQTLATWPESPLALETLLSVSTDDDDSVRDCSVFALARFSSNEATKRIQEIAVDDVHQKDRLAAVHALQRVQDPGSIPLLINLLHQQPATDSIELVGAAMETLHVLDEPSAVQGLRDLNPSLGVGRSTVASLIAYLSRNRSVEPGDSKVRPYVCTISDWQGYSGSLDPRDPRVLQIVPPSGMQSVRCNESPGVPWNPVNWMRLSAGSYVRIYDYFEGKDERWVEVDSFEGMHCWVQRRLLEAISNPNSWSREMVEGRPQREFDLPLEEAFSDHARVLREAGLLRTIDPSEDVVGVALDLHHLDRKKLAILLGQRSGKFDLLDFQIVEMLKILQPPELKEPEFQVLLNHLAGGETN